MRKGSVGFIANATRWLDSDEKAKLNLGLRGGGTNVVNEKGLYTLVLTSRKPEAKAFKRWITHEVIPERDVYRLVMRSVCEMDIEHIRR
ncbi:Bro-N domain-containing protein [Peribacillus simplex]|uniref:BRO-N domain-containing protein n=1 Tax=Peribacillus simplex TaxID=1478 RepID=UPI001C87E267|nr:Bro-N domain-containing protein [Peribacillus simplex]